jgi:hypothetical protein
MMHVEPPENKRELKGAVLKVDLCVVGGGLAGVCAAITAARAGVQVALVQDRPVLGGNASSEVRLWALGATVHMGTNNRWAREGGVINEITLENLWRNPEGNPLIYDTVLLEKVVDEPNITLLLNTAVYEVEKDPAYPDRVRAVVAFCAQNSTRYVIEAPLFCDASGDGIVGFLSGAAFRMGAESRDEFGEAFAPSGEFGHLLGHSIYFYSKDTGCPVKFVPPSFALKNIPGQIPRHRTFNAKEHGCRLWWIEYGGRLDTVHETETIKWELWRVVYGVWDYIKNSGQFPEAENLTLEWVGHIPGKRESRRFEGDYMLTQQDVIERRLHDDDVAFGGWSIDLHPADGVFAEVEGSHHLHSKGIYTIPYRCFYSRTIENLFLAGRIISASHVAFGTTRVMMTCAHGGQAVGRAAALCAREKWMPRDLLEPARMRELQQNLLRTGQHIPGCLLHDPDDRASQADVKASSTLALSGFPPDGSRVALDNARAQLLPVRAGRIPTMTVRMDVEQDVELRARVMTTSDDRHHCPDMLLAETTLALKPGDAQMVTLDFGPLNVDEDRYVFWIVEPTPGCYIKTSNRRVSGVLTLIKRHRLEQQNRGGDDFDVFTPERRPGGLNWALSLDAPLHSFEAEQIINGLDRPTHRCNAWVADWADASPEIALTWPEPKAIRRISLAFDVDYDHAMESVQMGHPERAVPFCARSFEVVDDQGLVLCACDEHHQARYDMAFPAAVVTRSLTLRITEMHGHGVPAAVFGWRCYEA